VLEGITETGHRLNACRFAVGMPRACPVSEVILSVKTALPLNHTMLYFSYQNFGQGELWFL
jgi:hypothetical protein